MLERIAPSPQHTLNKAVAAAEWQGHAAGLAVLEGMAPPSWLAGSYLWDAVLSDLQRRAGRPKVARQHRERALSSAPNDALRELLRRRLADAQGVSGLRGSYASSWPIVPDFPPIVVFTPTAAARVLSSCALGVFGVVSMNLPWARKPLALPARM
jgi:hypothetical protein